MGDDPPLTGRTALVTGASSGIGRATAVALARDGANVAVAARRKGRLESLAEDLQSTHDVDTLVHPMDVTEYEQVQASVEGTVDAFGSLDIVVANAGVARPGNPEEVSFDIHQSMLDVNVNGTFYTTRAALPHLRESSGTLVYTGSVAGRFPHPKNPLYAATKWWTRGFALSVAGAVGEDDVAISVVNPSEVRTEVGAEDGTPAKDRHEPGAVAEPEDVAESISFAARQDPPNSVTELDLFRRDKLGDL